MINKNILIQSKKEGFDEAEVYDAYKIFFGTLVSEPRLRIINLLRKGEKTVSEIMKELKMEQSEVSHNLARLRRCGFVYSKINGKFRSYNLDDEHIGPLMGLIDKHMGGHCMHILREVKKRQLKGGGD